MPEWHLHWPAICWASSSNPLLPPPPCLGHVSSVFGYCGMLPVNVKCSAICGLLSAFVQIGWLWKKKQKNWSQRKRAIQQVNSSNEVTKEEGCLFKKRYTPQHSTAWRGTRVYLLGRQDAWGSNDCLPGNESCKALGKYENPWVLVSSKMERFVPIWRRCLWRFHEGRHVLGSITVRSD